VEACSDLDDFLRAPLGRFVTAESWVYFYPSPALCGFALWGRLTEAAMRDFVRAAAVGLDRPPHAVVADARKLESVDPGAFDVFRRYIEETRTKAARSIKRLAIVRDATLGGAVVSGFFRLVEPTYPVEVFDTIGAAVEWLGLEEPSMLAEALEECASATTASRELVKLRVYLRANVATATLASAAKALGRSARSLQRRLSHERTSFQTELDRVRIRVAEDLLLHGDATLAEIASQVGCASVSSFSVLFRRLEGEAPATWRAARLRR
jgi:AraC-like DNA-binding protein